MQNFLLDLLFYNYRVVRGAKLLPKRIVEIKQLFKFLGFRVSTITTALSTNLVVISKDDLKVDDRIELVWIKNNFYFGTKFATRKI